MRLCLFWRDSPQWTRATSFTWFLNHTNDAPQSAGLLWTSDQLVAETSTWQHTQQSQKTKVHAPGAIRTHNLRRRTAADLLLRPRGNGKIKHRNGTLNHTVPIL